MRLWKVCSNSIILGIFSPYNVLAKALLLGVKYVTYQHNTYSLSTSPRHVERYQAATSWCHWHFEEIDRSKRFVCPPCCRNNAKWLGFPWFLLLPTLMRSLWWRFSHQTWWLALTQYGGRYWYGLLHPRAQVHMCHLPHLQSSHPFLGAFKLPHQYCPGKSPTDPSCTEIMADTDEHISECIQEWRKHIKTSEPHTIGITFENRAKCPLCFKPIHYVLKSSSWASGTVNHQQILRQ